MSSCPIFPHRYTEGDQNPPLIFVFKQETINLSSKTITVVLERPNDVLEKTLTVMDEQRALLSWDATDLQAGIGQIATLFIENSSNQKTTMTKFVIDVDKRP